MKKRVILGLLFAFAFQADAGLKIYYIRQNVEKSLGEERPPEVRMAILRGKPRSVYPGRRETGGCRHKKLKAYSFDFISCLT